MNHKPFPLCVSESIVHSETSICSDKMNDKKWYSNEKYIILADVKVHSKWRIVINISKENNSYGGMYIRTVEWT